MPKKYFVLAILILFSAVAEARVDINVYDDSVYSYLDKLAAAKLIRTYNPNQRPLSRSVVVSLIKEARSRFGEDQKEGLVNILGELENKFLHEEEKNVELKAIDEVNLSWTATNQPETDMPVNNLGVTTGKVQPLFAYQHGRRSEKYSNFYFDTSHWLNATPYFAAYLQPQFYSRSGDSANGGIGLYRGYVKAGVGDIELQVGRDDVHFGPGKYTLFFSDNAHGLDMIRLTTPATFRLPWLLSYLGQWKFTTFFAWLGEDVNPNNTILSAYRLDYQPFYWLDVGFDQAVMMGGTGARGPSARTAIGEYVGFLFDSGNSLASSNHLMGSDMSIRIPQLKGLEIYGKLLLEDTQNETLYMLKNDASWMGGIYLPRIDKQEKLSLRGEFIYTGQFAYRHGFYSDGFSLDKKFIGYDAGSDTFSGILETKYQFNLEEFVQANFRYLFRSSDKYVTTFDSTGNNDGIAVATHGVNEQHFIWRLSAQKKLTSRINVYGEAGFDRTMNKMFTSGNGALDFATQVKFIFHDL